MEQNRARSVRYSVPGKVFLLGEYSVLAGSPAIVAALGPRFALETAVSDEAASTFHPESPAGRLLSDLPEAERPRARFLDPWKGAGGFGASSAQFALLYRAFSDREKVPRLADAWARYRELASLEGALPPSGADLAGQWQGGVTVFHPSTLDVSAVWDQLDWSGLLIFSASHLPNRKTSTHDHLRDLRAKGFPGSRGELVGELAGITLQGIGAILRDEPEALGRAMSAFARKLSEHGLESEPARGDREALSRLPGVAGAKGCGALGSDAIAVMARGGIGQEGFDAIIATAEDRGLKLVSRGLPFEPGIQVGASAAEAGATAGAEAPA